MRRAGAPRILESLGVGDIGVVDVQSRGNRPATSRTGRRQRHVNGRRSDVTDVVELDRAVVAEHGALPLGSERRGHEPLEVAPGMVTEAIDACGDPLELAALGHSRQIDRRNIDLARLRLVTEEAELIEGDLSEELLDATWHRSTVAQNVLKLASGETSSRADRVGLRACRS
jgi:hypothetical protein